jgi:hypothetical protein
VIAVAILNQEPPRRAILNQATIEAAIRVLKGAVAMERAGAAFFQCPEAEAEADRLAAVVAFLEAVHG